MYTGLANLGLSGYHNQYSELKEQAILAARRNNASLWFAGAPSDLAGFVWQDSAGTVPATGTDPIGLLLDRQYGAENLGPELVTNGDFGSASGWTLNGNASISGGSLNVLGAISGGAVIAAGSPAGTFSAGGLYRVQFTISSIAGLMSSRVAGTQGTSRGTPGVYTEYLVVGGTQAIEFIGRGAGVTSAVIDNYSIRQVFGIPAIQATAANKPTLELQANGYFGMRFDGTSDFLDATFPASSTAGTQVVSILTPASPPAAFAVAYSAGTGGPQLFQNSSGQWLTGPTGGTTVNMGVQANASSRVFSAVLQSGTLSGRVNGGSPVTASVATYSGTTALVIGAQTSSAFFASIRLFLLCISTSAMPDPDRIAIERFAALLSGANYP